MHLHMHINIPEMSHNLQFLCVDMHFSSSVYVWERTLLCDISRYRDTCALTTLSSCLFQCGCQKVGRKINEGLCNRARGWWGWMIIVLLFTSYSLCHDVIILRHNPGLAQLVVVFSIPTKPQLSDSSLTDITLGLSDGLYKETNPDGTALLLLTLIINISAYVAAL